MTITASSMYSVIIVLYNSSSGLESCLRSIPEGAEVVVVDNASADDGVDIVRRTRPSAMVHELSKNIGFGAACNVGASLATEDPLVFLNPDTTVVDGALDVLASIWRKHPEDIIGPALAYSDGTLRANCRRWSSATFDVAELLPAATRWMPAALRRDVPLSNPVYANGGTVDYLQGACMMVSKDAFHAVGGFDTDFFLYCEEEDLCERLSKRGAVCRYVPQAVVRHSVGGSSAGVPLFSAYHMFRSKALLYRKRHGDRGGRVRAFVLAMALVLNYAINFLQRRANADMDARLWVRHALRGLRAGYFEAVVSHCNR